MAAASKTAKPAQRKQPKMMTMKRMRRNPQVAAYLAKLQGPAAAPTRRLRALVHKAAPDAKESILWGIPFFSRAAPLCYISPAKGHITLGFPLGSQFKDPTGLRGTGRSTLRKATLKLNRPLPEQQVLDWVAQAVACDDAYTAAGGTPL